MRLSWGCDNNEIHEEVEKLKKDVKNSSLGELSAKIDTKVNEMERKIEENCRIPVKTTKENMESKTKETQQNAYVRKENVMKEKRVELKSTKKKIKWIGTSLSNVLNKEKFEKDLNVELSMAKAYCIEKNFTEVVPTEVDNKDIDILVLQTGSIEITDLDINNAVIDTTKDLSDWFNLKILSER